METLGKDVKGVVSGILGSMKGKGKGESGADALISRIDAFLPFLPFTVDEKAVVAEELLGSLAVFVAQKKPDLYALEPRLIHNIRLHWTKEVLGTMSKAYDSKEGARSIRSAVLKAGIPLSNKFSFPPDGYDPATDQREASNETIYPGDKVRVFADFFLCAAAYVCIIM